MTKDQAVEPIVDLVLELPPPEFGRVTVDTSFPVVDQAFGSGSGSGWRLFEAVPGEEPPWILVGDATGNTFRQRARLPRSKGLVKWAAVCQVSLSWFDETPGADPIERSTTVDGTVKFELPADGRHTVFCVIHHQEATDKEAATWQLAFT